MVSPGNFAHHPGLSDSEQSKPKQNGYFEANKQFIAPLPIPQVADATRQVIAAAGKELQALHTSRRDAILQLEKRLASSQAYDDPKTMSWLWADVHNKEYWKAQNPQSLSGRQLTSWAKSHYEALVDAHLQLLNSHLRPGAHLSVLMAEKELSLLIDGQSVLAIYPSDDAEQCTYIAAQWKHICRSTNVTEAFGAKRLVAALVALRATNQQPLRSQTIAIDNEISSLEVEIAQKEELLNKQFYEAYELTDEEGDLVRESENA